MLSPGRPGEVKQNRRKQMPGKHRKHTPIVSEKQRGLFGAELRRREEGKTPRMKGITTEELRGHLRESKGKDLPLSTTMRRVYERKRRQ